MTSTIMSSGKPMLKGTESAYRAPRDEMCRLGGEDRRGELDVLALAQSPDRQAVDLVGQTLDLDEGRAGVVAVERGADLRDLDLIQLVRRFRQRPAHRGEGLRERLGVLGLVAAQP